MDSSGTIYLAFGSYGLTVFRNLTSGEQSREGMARVLNTTVEKLAALEMFLIPTAEGNTSAAIFKTAGKVSYINSGALPTITEIMGSSIDLKLKGGANIRLDAGITAILAQTLWGKTTFASRDLVPSISKAVEEEEASVIDYISFLEPMEDLIFDDARVEMKIAQNHPDFFKLIAEFLLSAKKVCVIDSLRSFIYDNSVGGTAAGGMDAYLPVQLTALSNVAAILGKHIVVVINPMMPAATEEDRGKFVDLQKRIESSIPTVMTSTGRRALTITMRGPSSRESQQVSYLVPEFEMGITTKVSRPVIPASIGVIRSADAIGNVIAGVVGSL